MREEGRLKVSKAFDDYDEGRITKAQFHEVLTQELCDTWDAAYRLGWDTAMADDDEEVEFEAEMDLDDLRRQEQTDPFDHREGPPWNEDHPEGT